MQPATTLTMASVGAVDRRVGDVLEADVAGRMDGGCTHAAILAPVGATPPGGSAQSDPDAGLRYLISEIPWSRMTEDYLGRIGNLIRDARKHRGLDPAAARRACSAPARARSTASSRATRTSRLEMLARIGEALDSEIVSLGAGPDPPAGHRPHDAVRQRSTSRPPRTPASRCCAPRCSTAAGRRCARSPASRRSTGSSRCSTASACRPAGSTTTTTSRSSRPRDLDLAAIDEDGRPPYPLDHHVPRPAAAPRTTTSSCRTPAAATSAPAPSSRTWPRCARSASRSRRPTGSYHAHASTARSRRPGRSCSPSAATPSPRTP